MLATPEDVVLLAQGIDHAEGVCVGPRGEIYAGGEEGQLYRISPEGQMTQVAAAGGLLLGLALDCEGWVHACNQALACVQRIGPDGTVQVRSRGTAARPMEVPNFPVFDRAGNLYVSDSGDYWSPTGTGCVWVIRPDDSAELFHAGPFRVANGLAIDPTDTWLYVVQSTGPNVLRLRLDDPYGTCEEAFTLPPHTVPDGLAFADDGSLVIACYRPDIVYLGRPDGELEVLVEDLTAELISRPTNAALHDGKLYLANLGSRHLSVLDTYLRPAPLHRPCLGYGEA
jgi:gluconolactonase